MHKRQPGLRWPVGCRRRGRAAAARGSAPPPATRRSGPRRPCPGGRARLRRRAARRRLSRAAAAFGVRRGAVGHRTANAGELGVDGDECRGADRGRDRRPDRLEVGRIDRHDLRCLHRDPWRFKDVEADSVEIRLDERPAAAAERGLKGGMDPMEMASSLTGNGAVAHLDLWATRLHHGPGWPGRQRRRWLVALPGQVERTCYTARATQLRTCW